MMSVTFITVACVSLAAVSVVNLVWALRIDKRTRSKLITAQRQIQEAGRSLEKAAELLEKSKDSWAKADAMWKSIDERAAQLQARLKEAQENGGPNVVG